MPVIRKLHEIPYIHISICGAEIGAAEIANRRKSDRSHSKFAKYVSLSAYDVIHIINHYIR